MVSRSEFIQVASMEKPDCKYEELDGRDKQILAHIQSDAKITIARLSDITGLSQTAVRARLAKLEATYIRGYHALLDCSKMGYREALLASLRLNNKLSLTGIKEQIDSMPEIKFAYITTGDYPVFVMAKCLGHDHAMRLIEQLRNLPGVEEVKTQMVLDRIKEDPTVIIP
ncbi:MAG: Lrp/AsnC family transcriptional regulator [Candidatus Lokiarchaeota archaeon]|nr:Lrp/AsnC family transcriptional regulator [Candidatus Lokiarchaeota archaeon]